MGLFSKFGKKKEALITCPISGEAIEASQIEDETFAAGILGFTVGVRPAEGKVFAPADGTVSMLFDTHHAIGLEIDGVELLIHVGVDTVSLEGKHFTPHIKTGDKVQAGQLLLGFDGAAIEAAGYHQTTAVIITNADALGEIHSELGPKTHGDPLLHIMKK